MTHLGLAAVPAVVIGAFLYLGIIGRELAFTELQSWLIAGVAVLLWVFFVFVWNGVNAMYMIWSHDQVELENRGDQIAALETKMRPTFAVVCDEAYRWSADGKSLWVVFRIHNNGLEAAHNCVVKLVNIICTFSTVPIAVRPNTGARLKWSNFDEPTCTISGGSQEYVNIAFRHADNLAQWIVTIQNKPEQFPLPVGVYELTIEAAADNLPSCTTRWQIKYKADGYFEVSPL